MGASLSGSRAGHGATRYPAAWAADVVLADGRTVRIRPIRPEDDERVLRLYERVSPESMYMRFFSPIPAEFARHTEHLTQVDQHEHVLIVAELGDELVAMARYDRQPDEYGRSRVRRRGRDQHRGLGTLLLEHLAAIGRDQGIQRFVATTLPQNWRMLAVFRDAGYEVTSQFDQGTVEVSFSIEPTDASVAAQERPRASRRGALDRGATRTLFDRRHRGEPAASTIGHEMLRNLPARRVHRSCVPGEPERASSVAGVRAYPTIADVPDKVDLAVVTVPAAEVLEDVRQCAAKGVQGLVIISAGFAEVGGDRRTSSASSSRSLGATGCAWSGPTAWASSTRTLTVR